MVQQICRETRIITQFSQKREGKGMIFDTFLSLASVSVILFKPTTQSLTLS